MSSLFRRGTKKKNKKAKEPPILPSARNTADGSKTAHKTTNRENDEDDVKEVLQLFNRLEELVVDGDPRVKEALNQKPTIQNLLREDSYSIISPRSYRPYHPVPTLPIKEPTDTSLLSLQRHPRLGLHENYSQLQPQRFMIPLQHANLQMQQQTQQAISPRRQVVVPPIRIPERTYGEDSFYQPQQAANDGHLTGRVKRHPDGTVIATIDSIIPPVENKPSILSPPRRMEVPRVIQQRQPAEKVERRVQDPIEQDPYHDFNYYNNKDGETSVRIVLDQNRRNGQQIQQRKLQNDKKQQQPKQVNKKQMKTEPVTYVIEPQQPRQEFNSLNSKPFAYRSAAMVSKGTGSTSKVIGPEGGRLNFLGCSVEIPKNALKDKTLIRMMILDVGQVPHATDRLYQPLGEREPSKMPITPAVRLDPPNIQLEKAVTVKLPTCIAVHGQGIESNGSTTNRSLHGENDIKADDIEIQLRSPNSNEVWGKHETEVFRSADSVTFKLQQFGDACAFHCESNEKEIKALNKRLSVYLFKSSDNRKHQFLSILLAEDLPHVIQKAVESVPHWLSYTDSCFNIILPEGKNFVVYIEPVDRTFCFTEANVMEIPWQNLWYPETVIRKHVQVTLLNRDTPTDVQLILDEGNIRFNTAFIWKVQDRSIILPDLLSSAAQHESDLNDNWDTESQVDKNISNDPYKTVKWKPESPDPTFVTNKGILSYAEM